MTVKLLNVFKEIMFKNRKLHSPVLSRKLFSEKSLSKNDSLFFQYQMYLEE